MGDVWWMARRRRTVAPARDLGNLKDHVQRVTHYLRPNLDQLVPQCGRGSVVHGCRQCQSAEEAAQAVVSRPPILMRRTAIGVARWR